MSLTKDASLLKDALNASLKGDLVPFRSSTIDLAYGGMEYARSVFGTDKITRSAIIDYFDNARANWTSVPIPQNVTRNAVTSWCKEKGIRPLHYYTPTSERTIWFKEDADLFAFTLKFGSI